ncbi:HAD family hydrolase [Dictyobacter kobayashii]|uniref:Phosphoglycolate phosphatase n=1 Tax=Dictyobacter kobayashii TaxID=2014872 RepID=A0A402AKH6_9CHLR|nr:HAD family hydrolase [Dictyobacter kobayashii]GCE19622.1 phosphoglycolate phosphatase [Dictyobacter kobayashii]
MSQHRPIKGVILDVDGTLVDSNEAHTRAWVEAMEWAGYHVDFKRVAPLIGMGGDKVLPEVLNISKDSPEGQRISQRRKEIFQQKYLATVKAFPGTAELLHHMHDQGLKLIIATSAEPDELNKMLQLIEPHIEELFENATTSKDASQSKPDPDVVQAAIERIKLSPQELIMIGDTAYDIEAASRASVAAIAFRSGGWSDEDLKGAVAIYDGPADLLKHYDESPLARGL